MDAWRGRSISGPSAAAAEISHQMDALRAVYPVGADEQATLAQLNRNVERKRATFLTRCNGVSTIVP